MRAVCTHCRVLLLLVGAVVASRAADAADQSKVAIYVGAHVREGFLDVDAGILDSIQDVQEEFRHSDAFSLARSRDEATLVLEVLARGIVTNGSVGFGNVSGGTGFGFTVPNSVPTLSTLLHIGSYEKVFQSESGTWKATAARVVKDLTAWLSVNREALKR